MNTRYEILPEHMQDGMMRYIEQGYHPGDFLYLMLCHEIYDATGHADHINLQALPTYIRFMYNEIPASAHGSRENVDAWMKSKQEINNG